MSVSAKPAAPAFGFFTIVDQSQHGLIGGYLVLNAGGRPLEFHCTSPVKPSRAQEILYGNTLKPYLYGEQIGQALVSRAKIAPLLVFVDLAEALSLREQCATPVVLVDATNAAAHADAVRRLLAFKLGSTGVALENRYSSDQPTVNEHWKAHGHALDLAEPFSRIREALEEAHKSTRAA